MFSLRHCLPQITLKNNEEEELRAQTEAKVEKTATGRVQRASAQLANFHLAEIANNELPKDWPKRKFQKDLVPDQRKVGTGGAGRTGGRVGGAWRTGRAGRTGGAVRRSDALVSSFMAPS